MNTLTTFITLWLTVFLSVVQSGHHWRRNNDVEMGLDEARVKIRRNSEKLWNATQEAVVTSYYDVLKLYTESTLEQAKEAVHAVAHYSNLTKHECQGLRSRVPAGQKALSMVQCINQAEINTIKAYKMTGFNLHVCIKNSQMHVETQFQTQVRVLEGNTRDITANHDHYYRTLDNCADPNCVLTTVLQSVVEHERLNEQIARNVTELHNLSTRYILTHIAVGCVGNANLQLEHNFEVGRNMARGCIDTAPAASQQES